MAVEGKRRCYHSARDGPRCASCRQLIKSFIEEGVKLAAKHVEKYFEGENRDSDPLQLLDLSISLFRSYNFPSYAWKKIH